MINPCLTYLHPKKIIRKPHQSRSFWGNFVFVHPPASYSGTKFNQYGQLTNIAFAPSRTHHNKQQAAEATSTGYSFTITGLDENTTYGYTFSVLNEESTVIEEFVGEFTTQSNLSTAVDNIDASTCGTQKLLRNGQLLILRDGKTYTVLPSNFSNLRRKTPPAPKIFAALL